MATPSCLREKLNPTISDEIRWKESFALEDLDLK